MTDVLRALGAVIAELTVRGVRGDRVAAAWARHFEVDRRSIAIWVMAHQDDEVGEVA